MCYKSKSWMDYLYKHKELFDKKEIKLESNKPNTAVIIEPRNTEMLELVIKNFMYYLHESWSLMIIYGSDNEELVNRIVESIGDVHLVKLNVNNLNMNEYNQLCVSEELYNSIPTENILMFQIDTILRKDIPENLLQYSYIGAPWRLDLPWSGTTDGIGNGGLSLRRRSAMLNILKYFNHPLRGRINEDVYFSMGCKQLKLNRPTYEIAKSFSVETVFYDDPIGLHKPHFTEEECKDMFRLPDLV